MRVAGSRAAAAASSEASLRNAPEVGSRIEAGGRMFYEPGGKPFPEAQGARLITEAEVQLLPPRLSAVLAQLRLARQQFSAGKRQNKVSQESKPHFLL